MKIYPLFPDLLACRLEPLREFLKEAEEKDLNSLGAEQREDLQAAIDYVWPGTVELGISDLTKAAFVFAGFAIGLGIHP
jgi:hypothetical protein